MNVYYAMIGKGSAPQPVRMRLPGWGGSPEKKMENGSEPQPWHCRPFVDAATYGLELVYPYETECHVINENGHVRFEWDYASEPGVKLEGDQFGVFDNTPARFYLFQASVDIEAPPGHVLQTQPHPRFFTDDTGTVPLAMIGHVQSEWWSRPAFVVFKAPPPGQKHIFRKGEPYVQILFVPQKGNYQAIPMTAEHTARRTERHEKIASSASYISTNVWHEAGGGEMRNYYKILARSFEKDGFAGVEETVEQAAQRRAQALPPDKTMTEYLELARQYQREGKYVEAKDIYISLILRNPENAEAASRLGILAESMGLPTFALELLRKAIALQPNEPGYHANLGEVLRRQGRLKEAEAALQTGLNVAPRDPQMLSNLAITLATQGRFPEALQRCRAAIETGTRLAIVYLRAGSIFAQQGQIGQARICFQTVLSLNPENAQARKQLADLPLESEPVTAFTGVPEPLVFPTSDGRFKQRKLR